MIVTSRLLIAAAVLTGSASVAAAQSYPFDGTPDKTLSYGPQIQAAAPSAGPRARSVATPTPAPQQVGADRCTRPDGTPDKTLSYGVCPR